VLTNKVERMRLAPVSTRRVFNVALILTCYLHAGVRTTPTPQHERPMRITN
jgi:hypothetical protein